MTATANDRLERARKKWVGKPVRWRKETGWEETTVPNIYIGVDPGASGGLAGLSSLYADSSPMPATEWDVLEWFRLQVLRAKDPHGTFACIELVNGYVGDGGNPGSRMFSFGANYGGLRMAMLAAGVPFEAVHPRVWQKGLGIKPRGKAETKTQFKNRLKARAQQLFPSSAVTLKTCDALLLAEFCRRKREGRL